VALVLLPRLVATTATTARLCLAATNPTTTQPPWRPPVGVSGGRAAASHHGLPTAIVPNPHPSPVPKPQLPNTWVPNTRLQTTDPQPLFLNTRGPSQLCSPPPDPQHQGSQNPCPSPMALQHPNISGTAQISPRTSQPPPPTPPSPQGFCLLPALLAKWGPGPAPPPSAPPPRPQPRPPAPPRRVGQAWELPEQLVPWYQCRLCSVLRDAL
jgi:hypothetical protein